MAVALQLLAAALLLPPHRGTPRPTRWPRSARGAISMGSKGKSSFAAYTISGKGSDIFPLPAHRAAIQVHKKHKGAGCPPSKAPAEHVPPLLRGRLDARGLRVLHLDPPVWIVDGFFSAEECESYRALAEDAQRALRLEQSATFSASTATARTSATWFIRYQDAPQLLARAAALLGRPVDHFEEPQLVRYEPGQRFTWHYDAIPPSMLANGGQRIATLLVYLNDVETGGCTAFRDLREGGTDGDGQPKRLAVQPKKGRALLFFPSDADGAPDERTLHAGEPAKEDKWIAQLWLHEKPYTPANLPMGTCQREGDAAARAFAKEWQLEPPPPLISE
ncbi:hypothetical protein AB1Y20_009528 [Prymnesium parvum]|uniref:Fe2OG dioxygenase domain-containing protein n=1 Tax=Prymnesium parvum TaxID=97485 RepID=A0AB34K4T8_PRYPA